MTLVSAPAATIEGAVVAAGAAGGNASSSYDVFIAESPLVPAQLAGLHASLVGGSPFWIATDTLELYSASIDVSAGLPWFPGAFSVPNPVTLDPYGLATVETLKAAWPRLLAKSLPITTDDALSSWSAVEYGFGTPAYGFTGKSQICTNVTGAEVYESGSYHHEYVLGRDYITPIAWTGLKLNRLSNGAVVARTAQAENAVNAFISFLSQAGVTVTDKTTSATLTLNGGKTDLAQSCLKTN
ncbi:hypothetical protein [Methylocystis bryophila]|uniref:ABC transporter substrate-binding protein n=1 Tax=Methylocystis bryophila TaxID=655015 RepID=A0A1W6MQI9_9HYPH|nr:hypothetical protein [Methylocystis bryophila]ARN79847.1 hypothetical protein B1812_00795 [Methylocystis bryophila]BDV39734.1 hypothetical protein DSM21852_29870 [Methylocystis bryophila]